MKVETGFASVNEAQLYYEIAGDGQPMILIHAGVADGRMWDEQFAAFATQFRVIRYDMRGFGRSAMPSGQFSNDGDVAVMPGIAHMLNMENQTLFNQLVLGFLKSGTQRGTE